MDEEPRSVPSESVDLADLGRRLSIAAVFFQHAVGQKLGLSITDHRCLSVIAAGGGAITPTDLVRVTGLTSGAISGVIGRLEKVGFVTRQPDPVDRRQVRLAVTRARGPEIGALFDGIAAATRELQSRYSPGELDLIGGYLERVIDLLDDQAARLRTRCGPGATCMAPRGSLAGIRRARLVFDRGASNVSIARGELGPEGPLYDARLERARADIGVDGGEITVSMRRKLLGNGAASFRLNDAVPWSLEIRGGAHNVDVDLRGLDVGEIAIAGGAHRVAVSLSEPSAPLAIRIGGGAHNLRVVRPGGVPARLRIGSGATRLAIDSIELGAVGGETRWASPDFDESAPHLDVDIGGGASKLVLTSGAELSSAGARPAGRTGRPG